MTAVKLNNKIIPNLLNVKYIARLNVWQASRLFALNLIKYQQITDSHCFNLLSDPINQLPVNSQSTKP